MKHFCSLLMALGLLFLTSAQGKDFAVFDGKKGPGAGKHIVFLSGDEEYRSEEALPQLAKILAERHGFKCTVLFAIDPATGTINPKITTNMPGAEALDSADVIVMALRFREWPDDQMKRFVDAYLAGKPIIALRTSTHAFNYVNNKQSPYAKYTWNGKPWPGGFGKQVLGETWVAHHGAHKKEATRGIIESSASSDLLLRGVTDVFGNSDVYTANPPADAKILVRGQVLSGMQPTDPPVDGPKNNPLQPLVWTRSHVNEAGKTNKILCTTMGAATDLESEGLRRLLVNAVYWGAGLEVPQKADVAYVGDYRPSMYGFDAFIKGLKVSDIETGSTRPAPKPQSKTLELRPSDHIALIGNTLPDRFQHSGWLETFIYLKHPDHDLVFRNLAVAGDEVKLRHRPENFGSADEWLKKTQASVIFAFFGFNESFRGPEGLPKFKADLDEFLKTTLKQDYSGKGPPQIILFSPIANERHRDPNFADPAANNSNIASYAEAMRETAAQNGVRFVDLFAPSQKLFTDAAGKGNSLTINGMHLTEAGDRLIAEVIYRALFGEEVSAQVNAKGKVEKLLQAVNDKSTQWHARYRTIDGNNIYGGRSALAYQPEKGGFITDRTPEKPYVSNFKVMQEELSQRDILTANRDQRIWAVARGGDLKVDDSNLPPVTPVKSNLVGPNADQSFNFLGGEEAIARMKIHSGMKVNLFATEEKFPELVQPVQMAWDAKGRLWVAVWPNYPVRKPTSKVGDSLLVFEDTNGDGKADKCTHFIDDLNGPTGFQFYQDGVLLMQAPDLWFIRDTDGDGKADWKQRILMGMSSADSHHTANAICLEPGGAVYLSDGVFHRTQVETASGPIRNNDAAIFRFEPATGKFDRYVPYDFANPHGRVFDYWGNDLITDATGNNTYFGPAFSGHIDYPAKHRDLKQFWNRPDRPCPGTGILTSRHFPEEFQGNFLNCNVIGFRGIYRVKVTEDGSGLKGQRLEDLVSSSDPNFRPTAVNVGADGAIYFCDWQNPIIGHMQHHLRDPNRDHIHGRIYRMTYEGRPLMKRPKIAGASIAALLDLLKEPENQIRELAKIELAKHDTKKVIAALQKWTEKLDPKDAAYAHNMAEALWVHQWHNVVDTDLLQRVMSLPDPRARAAAGRVLCYWRDRVPNALALFKSLADDKNERVRLEAVRAASFFRSTEALEVALTILKHPTDYYLDYTLRETLRQLEPWKRKALEESITIAANNPAGQRFLFQSIKTEDLLKLPRSAQVLQTILQRPDAPDSDRMVALADLSKARGQNRVSVLLTELASGKSSGLEAPARGSIARLLPLQNPEELKSAAKQLTDSTKSTAPDERHSAWASLVLAEGSFDRLWTQASASEAAFADLLDGIPLMPDQDFRSKVFDQTRGLLEKPSSEQIQRAAIRAMVSMNREYDVLFRSLTGLIERNQVVLGAAQGLLTVPRSKWPREQAAPAARGLITWAKTIPPGGRTSRDYSQVVQLAGDLAGLMPKEEAAGLRKQLSDLRVSLFLIRAVREQMRYDTTRLVVEAGKPFEIVFENADFMPHNLLVVKPDAREKLGANASTMRSDQLDREGRAYVPQSSEVLGATKMLQAGESESLKITAPTKEGDYEFFCSYPAHYQLMWGKLIVTKDVEAYLQQHPEAPIPASTTTAHEEGEGHAQKHSH